MTNLKNIFKNTIGVLLAAVIIIVSYGVIGAIAINALRALSLTTIEITLENSLNVGILLLIATIVTYHGGSTDE